MKKIIKVTIGGIATYASLMVLSWAYGVARDEGRKEVIDQIKDIVIEKTISAK